MYGHHVHEAVKNAGETESGITIHYVNDQYDAGDIIFQAKCAVLPTDSADDIAAKVHELEYATSFRKSLNDSLRAPYIKRKFQPMSRNFLFTPISNATSRIRQRARVWLFPMESFNHPQDIILNILKHRRNRVLIRTRIKIQCSSKEMLGAISQHEL